MVFTIVTVTQPLQYILEHFNYPKESTDNFRPAVL